MQIMISKYWKQKNVKKSGLRFFHVVNDLWMLFLVSYRSLIAEIEDKMQF